MSIIGTIRRRNYETDNFWIADLIDGYKKVNPVLFIFSLLTEALFNTSMLNSPKTSFKINEGTKTGTKNLPLSFLANSRTKFLFVTG